MQREWLTEYEWRKQAGRISKRRPQWWGAQCVYPNGIRRVILRRQVQRWMTMAAVFAALLLPMITPHTIEQVFVDCTKAEQQVFAARSVNAIDYFLPEDIACERRIFTRDEMAQGKMLLISRKFPLPDDVLPPNTASIALYGNGMVPVRSLKVQSGYETIDALQKLFEKLRSEGISGLYVYKGTASYAQQKEALIRQMRTLMHDTPIDQAAAAIQEQEEMPGNGSLLLAYAVEIGTADGAMLERSMQGQKLLQLCWRYGFIRESKEKPFRFRYVGKAHATAMTYLNLDLEDYLEWMHQKGTLLVSAGGRPQYLILCQHMQGDYAAFDLPVEADYEVSLDNTGYALAACTL